MDPLERVRGDWKKMKESVVEWTRQAASDPLLNRIEEFGATLSRLPTLHITAMLSFQHRSPISSSSQSTTSSVLTAMHPRAAHRPVSRKKLLANPCVHNRTR
jgi:hypothetical protein